MSASGDGGQTKNSKNPKISINLWKQNSIFNLNASLSVDTIWALTKWKNPFKLNLVLSAITLVSKYSIFDVFISLST